MFNNLSKYIYFFLVVIFCLFICFYLLFSNFSLNNNLIFLFTIILIPLFDYSLFFFGLDLKKIKTFISIKYSPRYVLIIFIGLIFLYFNISFLNILFIVYLLFGFLFKIKSDLSYITLLFLFFYSFFFFSFGNKEVSISLLVYSFYLIFSIIFFDLNNFLGFKDILICKKKSKKVKIKKYIKFYRNKLFKTTYDNIYIGIFFGFIFFGFFELFKNLFGGYDFLKVFLIFLLFSFIFILKKLNETNKLKNIYKFIVKNKTQIFNLGFILYFIIFIISFLYALLDLYKYGTFIFLILYFLLLFFGFRLNFFITKIKLFSLDFLNILIIFSSILYLFIHKVFVVYSFSSVLSLIYFIIFLCFSGIFIEKRNIKLFIMKNTYLMLSFVLIFILIFFILLKNNLIDFKINNFKLSKNENINKKVKELDEEISLYKEKEEKKVIIKEIFVKIKDIYEFKNYLNIGHKGDDVKMLQDLLKFMGFYKFEVTGEYDINTKIAVRKMLIKKCDWPNTTLGVFGPKAMDCFNNLVIKYGKRIN